MQEADFHDGEGPARRAVSHPVLLPNVNVNVTLLVNYVPVIYIPTTHMSLLASVCLLHHADWLSLLSLPVKSVTNVDFVRYVHDPH